MQASEALYKDLGGRGFVVLGILVENATGGPTTPANLRTWTTAYSVTFPVLGDPEKTVFKTYVPQTLLPAFAIVGRDGVITYRGQGTTDDVAAEEKLRAEIKAALSPSNDRGG